MGVPSSFSRFPCLFGDWAESGRLESGRVVVSKFESFSFSFISKSITLSQSSGMLSTMFASWAVGDVSGSKVSLELRSDMGERWEQMECVLGW